MTHLVASLHSTQRSCTPSLRVPTRHRLNATAIGARLTPFWPKLFSICVRAPRGPQLPCMQDPVRPCPSHRRTGTHHPRLSHATSSRAPPSDRAPPAPVIERAKSMVFGVALRLAPRAIAQKKAGGHLPCEDSPLVAPSLTFSASRGVGRRRLRLRSLRRSIGARRGRWRRCHWGGREALLRLLRWR